MYPPPPSPKVFINCYMHMLIPVHTLASFPLFCFTLIAGREGELDLFLKYPRLFTLQHRTKPSWQQTKPSFRLLSEPPSSSLPAPTTAQPTVTSGNGNGGTFSLAKGAAAPPPTLPTPATGIIMKEGPCSQLKCHIFYFYFLWCYSEGLKASPESLLGPILLPS